MRPFATSPPPSAPLHNIPTSPSTPPLSSPLMRQLVATSSRAILRASDDALVAPLLADGRAFVGSFSDVVPPSERYGGGGLFPSRPSSAAHRTAAPVDDDPPVAPPPVRAPPPVVAPVRERPSPPPPALREEAPPPRVDGAPKGRSEMLRIEAELRQRGAEVVALKEAVCLLGGYADGFSLKRRQQAGGSSRRTMPRCGPK
jgi:hypothetical protein